MLSNHRSYVRAALLALLLLIIGQLGSPGLLLAQPIVENPTMPPTDPPGPPPMDFQPPADADSLEDFLPPGVSLRHFDTPPGHTVKANLNRGQGDGLAYANDKVAVIMERNSAPNRSDLDFILVSTTPLATTTSSRSMLTVTTPVTTTEVITEPLDSHIFYRFDIELTENDQPGPELDKQVRIVVDLRDLTMNIDPVYSNYFLAYWDETEQAWHHVDTTVYQEDGLISAEVPHFSEWAAGVLPERWQPSWVPPNVSAFSGAATYSYSFNIPPGRNGMQPDMSLSYSSRAIDGRILNREVATIGDGWSLAEISVVRVGVKLDYLNYTTTVGTLHPNNFRLVFNGAGYRLIPSDLNATTGNVVRYYVENAPGFQVYRYYDATIGNIDGLYWVVDAPNGTRYRLGFTADAVEWSEVASSSRISEVGHTGKRWQTSVFAWHVDTVTDTHGNRMQYDYYTALVNETEAGFTLTTQKNRLAKIDYNYLERETSLPVPINDARFTSNPGSRIVFSPANTGRINNVAIYHGSLSSSVREYVLNVGTFTDSSDSDPNATAGSDNERCSRLAVPHSTTNYVLNSITEKVGSYTLPATTFTYTAYHHYIISGIKCFRFRYLTSVANGYGGSTTFTYGTDNRAFGYYHYYAGTDNTHYPDIGFSYYVTEKLANDGWQSAVKTTYAYETPCYSQTNASMPLLLCPDPPPPGGTESTSPAFSPIAGFQKTTVRHYDYNASTVLGSEVTTFSQNPYPAVGSNEGMLGQPITQEVYSGNVSTLLSKVETTYATTLVNNAARFTVAQAVVTREKSSGSSPELTHKVAYEYNSGTSSSSGNQNGNQYGNVTHVREYDSATASTPYRTTMRWYKPNTTNWVVDKVAYEIVYEGSSTAKQETRYFYDTQGSYTASPLTGELTKVTVQGPTMSAEMVSESVYDDYGNVTTAKSARGNSTTIVYDSGYKLYPVQVTNAAGQVTKYDVYGFKNAAGSLVAVDGFQKQPGLLKQVTDTNNVITKYEYDPFGRLHAVYDGVGGFTGFGNGTVNDGNPLKRYHYWDNTWGNGAVLSPFGVTEKTRPQTYPDPPTSSSDSLDVITYYDGFGRVIQERQRGVKVDATKKDVVVVTDYNALGQVACVSVPLDITTNNTFYSTKCSSFSAKTTMTYDGLGRVDKTKTPDGYETDHSVYIMNWSVNGFDPVLADQMKDAAGHVVNRLYNSRGEMIQVREYTGTSSYTEYSQTSYGYDALGNLTSVWDDANNVTTMTYDALGRKTGMNDPDMGSNWTYKYDKASNLVVQQKDAKGQQLCFSYDSLDRLTRRAQDSSPADNCPSSLPSSGTYHLASYTYDSATNGKGQLATVSWGAVPTQNMDTFFYDSFGRLTKQTRLLEGRSYSLETTGFDLLNRPLTVKYPTNEVVTLTYDREGENTLKAGSNDVVLDLTYNARGQLLKLDRAGSAVDTTYGYYNATGSSGNSNFRLQTMTHGSGSDVWPDMAYTYDKVGNILTLNTTTNGSTDNQTFGYDDLNRLTSAGATGAAGYSAAYAYNEIGNITSFEGSSYDYNNVSWNTNCTAPGQTMPHAVRKIGSQYFCYDANGNMTKRFDGTTTYTQNFDVENRLVSVEVGSATTTFVYDASGQRVKTVEPGGKTTYFPFPNYEETVVGGSTIKRSSYALAGQVIAMRVSGDPVSSNNGLFFIYSDHLGSTTMLGTSSGGMVAGSLARYRPYGSYRTAPTQTLTDRDFTGQRENREIGLLYYNARFYHPGIGRFISPDTLIPNPTDPQNFNRYTYVLNSPINLVDPSGHIADCALLGDTNDVQACNDPKPSIPNGSMISFTGKGWSKEAKGAISSGAIITGTALAQTIMDQHPGWGSISPSDAFLLTYQGSVTFNRTGSSCVDDSRNTIAVCAARTEGRNMITVYTDADAVTNKSHWARHELGHAFVHAVGSRAPITALEQAINDNPLLDRGADKAGYYGFASDQNSPRLWQQSVGEAGTDTKEIWADMYLGWTSNTWEISAAGLDRSTFMTNNMPLLVDIALAQP